MHSSDWARCQKAIGGIYFTKKWRAGTLQPGFEFDSFKPWLKGGIFKCISWLKGSFFSGDEGFLRKWVKINLMAPMSPLHSPTFFFVSHLYSVTLTGCKKFLLSIVKCWTRVILLFPFQVKLERGVFVAEKHFWNLQERSSVRRAVCSSKIVDRFSENALWRGRNSSGSPPFFFVAVEGRKKKKIMSLAVAWPILTAIMAFVMVIILVILLFTNLCCERRPRREEKLREYQVVNAQPGAVDNGPDEHEYALWNPFLYLSFPSLQKKKKKKKKMELVYSPKKGICFCPKSQLNALWRTLWRRKGRGKCGE